MSNAKRVFITGASAGFGYGAAKELAKRGHTVYATMRGINGKNSEVARELEQYAKDGGYNLHVLELDVTNDASTQNAVNSAIELGGFDVVINNAGIGNWGIDEGFTVDQAQKVFDVNLFGVMRLNHAALPYLRKSGQGLVIYVSSGLGRIVFPFMSIYNASKFAIEAYAESTGYELEPLGVQSVIVQPGAYGTSFLSNTIQPTNSLDETYNPTTKIFEAFGGSFEERAKAGELGDPSEVVQALVEEVEYSGNTRQLRHPVGQDMHEPVGSINDCTGQVQGELLKAFGLK